MIVSNADPTVPDVRDFEEEALHPNCRCQLVLVPPEAVYKNLHGQELLDWVAKNTRR